MNTAGGSIIWELDIDDSKYKAGLVKAGVAAEQAGVNINNAFKGIGSSLTSIGKSMTVGLTLPIIGFGTIAVKEFGDFNESIRRAGAFVNATEPQIESLGKTAIAAAKGTRFSFQEAADAIGDFIGGGITAEGVAANMGDVVNLALVSGFTDLKQAVNLSELALITFKDTGITITDVMDRMAKFAADVDSNTQGLGISLTDASGAAKTAGFSFDDLLLTLSAFRKGGMTNVEEFGTAFKSAIIQIQSPAKGAADALAAVGLSTKEMSAALKGGPIELLDFLRKGFEEANKAGNGFAFLSDVLGQRAAPEFAAALQLDHSALLDLQNDLVNSSGAGNQLAQTMRDNTPPLERLVQLFHEFNLQVAPILIPFFEKLVDVLTKVSNAFDKLTPQQQQMIVLFVGALAIVGPIVLILGTLAAAIAFLATPIGLIAIAIVGLATLFSIWIAFIILKWDDIVKAFRETPAKISAALAGVYNAIISPFKAAFDWVYGQIGKIGDAFNNLNLSSIGSAISGVFGGARAMGGPVSSNQAYLVGERGPELFVPGQSGTIVPNGGGNTFNFQISEKVDLPYVLKEVENYLGGKSQMSQFGIS